MPNEFDESPRYLPDPYIACHSSEILHPDYRKCKRCPCKDYCDIYDLEQALTNSPQLKLRDSAILNQCL